MLLRALSTALYIVAFVPASVLRRVRGNSRFGVKAHHAPTAWDR